MLTPNFIKLSLKAVDTAIGEMHLPKEKILEEQKRLFQEELSDKKIKKQSVDLEIPKIYDIHSYSLFKAISRYLNGPKKKLEFTQIVGREIYKYIKKSEGLVEGSPDDLNNLKGNLIKIIKFLEKSGYVKKAKIEWKYFNIEEWKQKGKAEVVYIMKNPVILPSAQRLFREEGFGQHFSTRTIEYGLLRQGILGRETKDFDPNKFNISSVAEVWTLNKIRK